MAPTATLGELVDALGGLLEPDTDAVRARAVHGVCSIEHPRPGHIAALSQPRFARHAGAFDGAALIVRTGDPTPTRAPRWCHPSPEAALDAIADRLRIHRADAPVGIASSAIVDPAAHLADDVGLGHHVVVAAGVTIGQGARLGHGVVVDTGATIGARARIAPGAYIGPGCKLGDDVHIGPNAVIGSDGFGYRLEPPDGAAGCPRRPHVGGVVIEDDVHIGAGTCIDAGRLEPTRIGAGSRIDNLVHLAHNVQLGARCWVLAQAGVAGSSVLGNDCALGGQAGVAGHLTIGAGSQVAAQAGVGRNVAAARQVGGSPAYDLARWRRVSILERELETRYRQIDALERRLCTLEAARDGEGS